MKIIAIITAGGSSLRFGGEIPKQYYLYNNKLLIEYSLEKFSKFDSIKEIVVVIKKNDKTVYKEIINKIKKKFNVFYVDGGKERYDSIQNALQFIRKFHPTHVITHDASRPFISSKLIEKVIEEIKVNDSAVPVFPIHSILKIKQSNKGLATIKKSNIYSVQTPQGFNFSKLLTCYQMNYSKAILDDSNALEMSNIIVNPIEGCRENHQIISMDDLYKKDKLIIH